MLRIRIFNCPVFLFALVFVGVSVGHASNQSLSSVVGFYRGQIESIEMVSAETEFFFDSSGSVVGRYRYQDQGSWDSGTLFNLRLVTGGGCGTNRPTTVTADRSGPADESDSVLGRAMLGAAGKREGSKSTQVRVSGGQGELCLSGIWQDRYGQGPVELRFNPTRDYFSGYYWSPGDEKAVWNGTNIPSGQQVAQINKSTVTNDNSAGGAKVVAVTTGEKYFEKFEAKGVGNTKEYAIKEAYFFALQRQLTYLVGYAAEGDIGRWFRESYERDFDSFKQKYFTPDARERSCFLSAGGKHECTIEGSIKLAAVKIDVRKINKQKERVLSDSLVFFLSTTVAVGEAAKRGDEWKDHAEYFVDQLEGVLVRRGHRVVFGVKGLQAEKNKEVDYGLSVVEISFVDISKGVQSSSGALRVRFKLSHLESSTTLANVPLTEVGKVSGDIVSTLVAELSRKASEKIALSVTESVIAFQRENDENSRAKKRLMPGQQTYYLRLVGLQQRNRKELKFLRESLKGMFADSTPTTDPEGSDSTQVTLIFSTAKEVDHDGLLDFFYEVHKELEGFDAEYLGNNEYVLYFKLSSPVVTPAVDEEDEESSKKPSNDVSTPPSDSDRD